MLVLYSTMAQFLVQSLGSGLYNTVDPGPGLYNTVVPGPCLYSTVVPGSGVVQILSCLFYAIIANLCCLSLKIKKLPTFPDSAIFLLLAKINRALGSVVLQMSNFSFLQEIFLRGAPFQIHLGEL
jgi:hypothetical protein